VTERGLPHRSTCPHLPAISAGAAAPCWDLRPALFSGTGLVSVILAAVHESVSGTNLPFSVRSKFVSYERFICRAAAPAGPANVDPFRSPPTVPRVMLGASTDPGSLTLAHSAVVCRICPCGSAICPDSGGGEPITRRDVVTTPLLDAMRPFLKQNTFLGGLPAASLDALLSKGQECAFERGDFIYRRGDPGNSLMIVLRGRIKLANTNVSGKEVTIDYLAAGDVFGETSALDGRERAVDATALESADIFVIPSRVLLPTLLAHPDAMLAVIRVLCERSRAGAAIIEDNTLKMRARTARGLLRLARQRGHKGAGGLLQLIISQEELGKYLDLTRGNVNRQLATLKNAGHIRIQGTEITIVDEKDLDEIAAHGAGEDGMERS
jgi:CRP/FNR family transcriptional regulator, cyclic AMP receptor protein